MQKTPIVLLSRGRHSVTHDTDQMPQNFLDPLQNSSGSKTAAMFIKRFDTAAGGKTLHTAFSLPNAGGKASRVMAKQRLPQPEAGEQKRRACGTFNCTCLIRSVQDDARVSSFAMFTSSSWSLSAAGTAFHSLAWISLLSVIALFWWSGNNRGTFARIIFLASSFV